jgi:hypothetical protein
MTVWHLSLSWTTLNHSMYFQPIFVRLILILFYNPHVGLPFGLFTSGFSSKSLHAFLCMPHAIPTPSSLI